MSKFEFGSVWYKTTMMCEDVIRITGEDKWDILYCSRGRELMTGEQSFSDLSNAVPFYAPPSQEELDCGGYEIDCIRTPVKGDMFITVAGNIAEQGNLSSFTNEYDALRYILKRKAKVNHDELLLDVERDDVSGALYINHAIADFTSTAIVGSGIEIDNESYTVVSFVYEIHHVHDETVDADQPIMWWTGEGGAILSSFKNADMGHTVPRIADKARCVKLTKVR